MITAERDVVTEYDREEPEFREIRFRFQSEPGYYVPCHLLIPKNAAKPLPTVIALQGHSMGMHISLGRTKYPGETVDGDRDFCVRAVREGFAAIALEQRDFGECGGNENGPQCFEPAMADLLIGRTVIGERVWDVMRCVDTLISDFADIVDKRSIYVMATPAAARRLFTRRRSRRGSREPFRPARSRPSRVRSGLCGTAPATSSGDSQILRHG